MIQNPVHRDPRSDLTFRRATPNYAPPRTFDATKTSSESARSDAEETEAERRLKEI